MTATAPVSVIVVNWNGGDMLGECLASLFAQTVADLEILAGAHYLVADKVLAKAPADKQAQTIDLLIQLTQALDKDETT